MKKFFILALLSFLGSSILPAQIDSAAVVRGYYKNHGWSGIYEQITKADQANSNAAEVHPAHEAMKTPPLETAAEILPVTSVQWNETSFDFGKINGVDSVKHVFKFKNTGNNPLKITSVKPACGCTAGKYTEGEILPGKEGYVELKFSPVGKAGLQNKSATVLMNTDPATQILTFSADIVQ